MCRCHPLKNFIPNVAFVFFFFNPLVLGKLGTAIQNDVAHIVQGIFLCALSKWRFIFLALCGWLLGMLDLFVVRRMDVRED